MIANLTDLKLHLISTGAKFSDDWVKDIEQALSRPEVGEVEAIPLAIGICIQLLETGEPEDLRVVIKNLKEIYSDLSQPREEEGCKWVTVGRKSTSAELEEIEDDPEWEGVAEEFWRDNYTDNYKFKRVK